ncbi:hypothetical protein BDV95DRAFT_629281 [Massariosphaeria phaeospora]|uniref:Uncharacterized protein n=1 Tax=Massariosphaeria phaeospora TaxID=100035 RepID=A0A7C8MAX1_9PLEO|nr:hypothetical protein BDV95DRAFT_629281 [Massariosphaeria phaeospora]
MASFENKIVIVTGCSSGIGLATALLFLNRQARVFGIDVAPFKHELAEGQREALAFHQANLTEGKACDDAVAACQAKFGPKIDVLVNCAGIMDGFSSADTVQDAELERVLAINLTVPIKLMRAVLPSMKEQKAGAIVNVCSRAAVSGGTAGLAYTASKHGLAGATKNVAWRFHNDHIRCNAVLPGAVVTNISSSMQMDGFDPAGYAMFAPVFGLHTDKDEVGQPVPPIGADDVARAISFLASDESKLINGVLLPVDNAWSAT